MGKLKSSYVKEVLIKEYGDDIGFHETPEKNKSEFVNNTKGGSNYVKAVSNSFGITDDQSILNLAPQLSKHIKELPSLNWCPTVELLLEEERVSQLLLKLPSTMKKKNGHKELSDEDNLVLHILASLITYFITRKSMLTSVNFIVAIHRMTRSKEVIDILHKCGICISYKYLLLLYPIWALQDPETFSTYPCDITYRKPSIVKVDNDDSRIDTLTGNAVMQMVPIEQTYYTRYQEESNSDSTTGQNVTKKEK